MDWLFFCFGSVFFGLQGFWGEGEDWLFGSFGEFFLSNIRSWC